MFPLPVLLPLSVDTLEIISKPPVKNVNLDIFESAVSFSGLISRKESSLGNCDEE